MVVRWTNPAKADLRKIFKHIALDSPQNAEKVRDALVKATYQLIGNSEKYPLDKLKIDNDGCWRAFELHHYRVSYHIENEVVFIIRVRHTKMSPLYF